MKTEFFVMVDKSAFTEEAKRKYNEWQEEYESGCEEGGLLFDDFKLEEIYIDMNGDLNLTAYTHREECQGVYLSICIEFTEWFYQLAQRNDFDTLIRLLKNKEKEIHKTVGTLEGVRALIKRVKKLEDSKEALSKEG